MSRILGIDPGSRRLGLAVIETDPLALLDYVTVEPDESLDHPARLMVIQEAIKEIVQEFKPQGVCIERLFIGRNVKSVMGVAEARGAILAEGRKHFEFAQIYEPTPTEVKKAAGGNHKSDKKQLRVLLEAIFKRELPGLDDGRDSIAIALCYPKALDIKIAI